jgi:hypothetical protein
MAADANSILLTLPPRELLPAERALLCEWHVRAGDIAGAFVCDRSSDDPALYRRIVVIDYPDDKPTHLIYQPAGQTVWVKYTVQPYRRMDIFHTLRTALNAIRPVLPASTEGAIVSAAAARRSAAS